MDSIASSSSTSLKDRLIPSIYFERQEPDSSLCAQHCLNSLIQEPIYQAADLAEIASQLDEREAHARQEDAPTTSSRRRQASPTPMDRFGYLNTDRSRNMDDSGFFSVQVMDEALQNFGLQLVRWRSELMRPMQDSPEQQAAFVFNLCASHIHPTPNALIASYTHSQQHWFVIRRFGHSKHFWFDLNSFHPKPKHVSPLYLGLQIDQAEHEGYSVFAVMSRLDEHSDALKTANIPACPADDFVYALANEHRSLQGQQDSFISDDADRRTTAMMDDDTVFTSTGSGPVFSRGFGNEDEELNRAIEASLQPGPSGSTPQMPTTQHSSTHAPPRSSHTYFVPPEFESEDPELAAAIAASLADISHPAESTSSSNRHEDEVLKATIEPTHSIDDDEDPDFWAAEAGEDEDDDDIRSDDGNKHTQNESNNESHLEPISGILSQTQSTKVESPPKKGAPQEQEEEVLTSDEIRRRRLARFG